MKQRNEAKQTYLMKNGRCCWPGVVAAVLYPHGTILLFTLDVFVTVWVVGSQRLFRGRAWRGPRDQEARERSF
jgi:hypothetical protein